MSTVGNKLCEIDPLVSYRWRIKPLVATAIKESSKVVRTGIGAGLNVTLFYKTDVTKEEVRNALQVTLKKYCENITIDDFIYQQVIPATTPSVLY